MKMHRPCRFGRYRMVVIAAAVLSTLNAAFTSPAQGQILWKDNVSGDWNDSANWFNGVIPQSLGDSAAISDSPTPVTATIDFDFTDINKLPFVTLDLLQILPGDTLNGSGLLQLLSMDNSGTIDANVAQQAIKIQPGTLVGTTFVPGSGTLTNNGTMRSSAVAGATRGGLQLLAGTYINNGVIEAVGGNGAKVTLQPGATINGGVLQAVGSAATIEISASATVDVADLRADAGGLIVIDSFAVVDNLSFNGIVASNQGTIEVRHGATIRNTSLTTTTNGQIVFKSAGSGTGVTRLESIQNFGDLRIDPPSPGQETLIALRTALTNDGLIELVSSPGPITIMLEGDVTLDTQGLVTNGTLTMAGTNHTIKGTNGTERLTHGLNHTIQGHGQIGAGLMSLTNQGTLNANVSGSTLSVAPNSDGVINTATGTLQATNGGRLDIVGATSSNTLFQQDGLVTAVDVDPANANVISRVTVNNLTLTGTGQWIAADGGIIQFNSGTTGSIGSLTAQNAGTIEVNGPNALTTGSLNVDSASTFAMSINAGFDKVTVTNNVTLAGTLNLLVDTTTFTPLYGAVFEALTYTSRTGTFDQVAINDGILALQTNLALAPVYDFPGAAGDPLFTGSPFAPALDSLTLFATLPGDANLDLKVDDADLSLLLTNFGSSGAAWIDGDFTGNGIVDDADLSLQLTNFGTTVTSGTSAGLLGNAVVIPEPATIMLFLLGLFLLYPRRAV